MEYISTRNKNKTYSFKDVFLSGLAEDGGLYLPAEIPFYTPDKLKDLKKLSYQELAINVVTDFFVNTFSENEVKELINNSYDKFRIKNVVEIKNYKNLIIMELFHGPTLAFKDIAMQVIGNMYDKILQKEKSKINIIVATSGDTGAAAIGAIKGRKNIQVFVLHPKDRISEVQRKFMTTVEKPNVFNLAIEGNFDDCQLLVKSMFNDSKFRNLTNLSGVNSINWARIIFQIVYYFFAYSKTSNNNEKINFSVPTGNFGDIYAGYIAKKMGLPIEKLIVATNKNDILKRVIKTGIYKPLSVQHTISPSMDIQVASNFERLIFDITSSSSDRTKFLMNDLASKGKFELEEQELKKIQNTFYADSLDDESTKNVIKNTYNKIGILIDPHTAVAIGVANKISLKNKNIVLSTAHPAKFSEEVMKSTGIKPELPEDLKEILSKKERFDLLPNKLDKVKDYILQRAKI